MSAFLDAQRARERRDAEREQQHHDELRGIAGRQPRTRAECSAVHRIERGAILVCNLTAGHDGSRHYDEGDRVFWEPNDSENGTATAAGESED